MSNILIDSSAWIEYFKGNASFAFIKELIKGNLVCTNYVVLTELLPSMRQKNEHDLIDIMNSIQKYAVKINWKELQAYQSQNLLHGNNNVPITDLIIMQNCIDNDLKIVARDKYFGLMAKYLPLTLYAP
jgi:predicted nucleic acid-binding protein